jgi:hypothetical protein
MKLANIYRSWCNTRRRTNFGGVVSSTKNELGCTVVPRADVWDVGLILDQDLSTAKVAQLKNSAVGIEKEVLRLDVSVADALRVDVGKGSEELVDVQLDLQGGHSGLHFIEKTRCPVDGLRNEFLDEIEIDLILL